MSGSTQATSPAPDFTRLYAQLRVAPGCGLAAFKQAYRRRVADLHPDRPAVRPRDPDVLKALNLGYAAALDFHRAHGRLPGAPVPPRAGAQRAAWHAQPAPPRAAAAAAATPVTDRHVPPTGILLLLVLLAIAAIWRWLPAFDGSATRTAAPATVALRAMPGARELAQLGMDRDAVASVLGEPVARDGSDSRWIYGPSWVRFDCGRLADWYSSPLRPLRVASQQPRAATAGARVTRARSCPRDDADARASAHGRDRQGGT